MVTRPEIVIYTDGACAGNPGPGGWGALLQFKDMDKQIFGYELDTTNNRMEIIAAIEALSALKKSCDVTIYTDSKYLQLGITTWIHNWIIRNWRTSNNKDVKNADLWRRLHKLLLTHNVVWKWIKGHAQIEGNVVADALAVRGKETAMRALHIGI